MRHLSYDNTVQVLGQCVLIKNYTQTIKKNKYNYSCKMELGKNGYLEKLHL
jgi:hypothetical protein